MTTIYTEYYESIFFLIQNHNCINLKQTTSKRTSHIRGASTYTYVLGVKQIHLYSWMTECMD